MAVFQDPDKGGSIAHEPTSSYTLLYGLCHPHIPYRVPDRKRKSSSAIALGAEVGHVPVMMAVMPKDQDVRCFAYLQAVSSLGVGHAAVTEGHWDDIGPVVLESSRPIIAYRMTRVMVIKRPLVRR